MKALVFWGVLELSCVCGILCLEFMVCYVLWMVIQILEIASEEVKFGGLVVMKWDENHEVSCSNSSGDKNTR